MINTTTNEISMQATIGKGYADFWRFKGRYRVVKGSRASKKSKTAALYYISKMMEYPGANLLVVRKVFRTLKDSCYTELKWAIRRLGVEAFWHCTESPLEMTYKPTGQKIFFRGLDDPLKVTSLTVETGRLCWLWLEEAYEIMNEDDFDMLDESIRGETPDGLWKQLTLTFNPWNEKHWIKPRFFDVSSPGILAKTTDYRCNEWLDDADRAVFENMRKNNPRRYRVAGLGEWGIVEGLIYENWVERKFNIRGAKFCAKHPSIKTAFGLDFGYTNDPSGLFAGAVDLPMKRIYVFDEMYEKALSNKMIYERVRGLGYAKERITADSAEPKSIDELRELGLPNIRGARKGKDSVLHGIQYIQDFRIIIHPRCVNFLTEISNYTWDVDKFGKKINKPVGDFNHLMDAMRYGLEDFVRGDVFSFD